MPAEPRQDNPFSGAFLERRSESRLDEDWLAAALADEASRFTLARGTRHLVRSGADPRIAFLDRGSALVRQAGREHCLLLGWYEGARCVLIDSAADERDLPTATMLEELRPLLAQLRADEAAILSCARALLVWRARHRHCGVCGAPTTARSAGHALRCTSSECGAEFFPRIDPAIIVLVSDGDQVLLGRQSSWPPGRYSALAGFVEAGESLEDAVQREVQEETGVRVQQLRYFASQPWPFPSSLMLGFHAVAARAPLRLDGELEDARWYNAGELAAAAPGMLPPRHTIARRLIEHWYLDVSGQPLPDRL
jgi:NAD+ diphosphatase